MQVDDLKRRPLADPAVPESGAFINFRRRRTLSERLYRFLERAGIVIPVTQEKPPQRSPSTR